MAFDVATAVSAIEEAAGWRPTAPDADGVWHYFLEDGLDLNVFSPDGRTCVFDADLGSLPDPGPARDEELVRIGRLVAASLKTRASILSVRNGRLSLHRTVRLQTASERQIVAQAQDFLNDQAWWRRNLNANVAASSSSAFSFPSGWFPGQMTF